MFKMPVQYMFKDIPNTGKKDDYIAYTVELMDKFNIDRAMSGLDDSTTALRPSKLRRMWRQINACAGGRVSMAIAPVETARAAGPIPTA